VRIFVTGFAVYFISPETGTGLFHVTEGWAMFVVAFAALWVLVLIGRYAERLWHRRRADA